MFEFESDSDALSNSVLDAIAARKYDEAEKRCQRLLREYPEMPDGHERLARLRKAQERFQEAAEHYTKALEMIARTPDKFDPETVADFTKQRDLALVKSKR